MAKRQSEIEIPFTHHESGEYAWAIVDHKVVLKNVAVDDYYLVFNFKKGALIIMKRDLEREKRSGR